MKSKHSLVKIFKVPYVLFLEKKNIFKYSGKKSEFAFA